MKFRAMAAALAVAAAAMPASADIRGALFITPMGEPFRSTDPAHPPIQGWFAAADKDSDGKISTSEYMTDAMAFFETLDANHDGNITSIESTAFWERQTPEILTGWSETRGFEGVRHGSAGDDTNDEERRAARRAAQEEERPHGAAAYGLINTREPVMSCDANFDRRITRDEFQACAAQRFSQIDANHDGFFELSEAHLPR